MIKLNPYTEEARLLLVQQVQMQMSEARFEHVLGVEQSAIALAKRYGCSVEKASIAALTHDYAKERSADEFRFIIENKGFDLNLLRWGNAIWHGLVGAYFVEHELGITDHDILEAIRLHTTGAPQMSLLSKIIYVADYIEPGRDFPGVEEARRLAVLDLNQAVAFETKQTLQYLIGKNFPIYPKTIETYNQWVAKHS
ncbi:bis(5'-nucleosyl)-tetraphosphatase (symmetrical) YqeK [Enterococcus sp. DIV1314a]|uniref:bis(5'-nucleosyl)-tetraphosphatase (symmetrical) YqeK n=1 Tax=Enterococcus sp. DIV1314a TaxID=2774660 RepID=UPI003F23147A